jgi:hypothetical protein
MLAPALATDREQQKQHILTPASVKDALAQHHANHYSVFGAARHTHIQASTRIRAHIRTPAHTHTHAHNYTHTNTHAREHSQARTRMYTSARTNTQTHARAHIQMPKHTGTHTHTHTHTRTHAYACTCCARDGLLQFFSVASDALALVRVSVGLKCSSSPQYVVSVPDTFINTKASSAAVLTARGHVGS